MLELPTHALESDPGGNEIEYPGDIRQLLGVGLVADVDLAACLVGSLDETEPVAGSESAEDFALQRLVGPAPAGTVLAAALLLSAEHALDGVDLEAVGALSAVV